MKPSEYPAWEMHPRHLNKEEADLPLQVIDAFFDYGNLPQIRDMLWLLLETTVTGSFSNHLTGRERRNLLYFYQQLEKLVEAVHVLHKNKDSIKG